MLRKILNWIAAHFGPATSPEEAAAKALDDGESAVAREVAMMEEAFWNKSQGPLPDWIVPDAQNSEFRVLPPEGFAGDS